MKPRKLKEALQIEIFVVNIFVIHRLYSCSCYFIFNIHILVIISFDVER